VAFGSGINVTQKVNCLIYTLITIKLAKGDKEIKQYLKAKAHVPTAK
jgi:hypothetical protein